MKGWRFGKGMGKIAEMENKIDELKNNIKVLEENSRDKRIRKTAQKQYPELDLTWFRFTNKETLVFPEGSRNIIGFALYGIENKADELKKRGVLKLNPYGLFRTDFTKEECELFYNEILSVCGYLLFPCFRCSKYCQLKDLYVDNYGYYQKETISGQLNCYDVSRCKKCAEEKVKEFNTPRPYTPKLVDKGGRWKGSYKLSDGGGGLRD